MIRLDDNDLRDISGGSISGTLLQYATKLLTSIFDIGRVLGTSIRRMYSDAICPVQKSE